MIVEFLILTLTSLLAYFLYAHKRAQNYFNTRGVKYLPGVPVFDNVLRSTFLKNHIYDDINRVYNAFPNERYVGFIEGTTPIILIRDPELIKAIAVKDFDHFVDHKEILPEELAPLLGGSLLMMKGERWRHMRTALSPAFTGSKLKHMLPFMTEISDNIMEYLKDHQSEDIDVDDLVRRYTSDVIASAAFGLQVNSLKDRDNEFYLTGRTMFKFTPWQRAGIFLSTQFPSLVKKLGINVFPEKTTQFFRDIVTNTIEYRKKNNVERPDMIQLLMEASKGTLKADDKNSSEVDNMEYATAEEILKPVGHSRKWTEDELAAQVFIFFIAGFESSANTLCTCIHELALNPHFEDLLYQEIREYKDRREELCYEYINELKFLDAVLSESSRKWSIALFLDRVCTKSYMLPPPGEGANSVKINAGDIVYNLVNSLHMDPKYFPKPDVFNPERFTEENKHKIIPFTYMPFGVGPRNCIGSRFALMELKVFLYNLILNYKIRKTDKTSDPIRPSPEDFNIRAAGGTWVSLEARN